MDPTEKMHPEDKNFGKVRKLTSSETQYRLTRLHPRYVKKWRRPINRDITLFISERDGFLSKTPPIDGVTSTPPLHNTLYIRDGTETCRPIKISIPEDMYDENGTLIDVPSTREGLKMALNYVAEALQHAITHLGDQL